MDILDRLGCLDEDLGAGVHEVINEAIGEIESLRAQVESLSKPDGFGTEDEHWASSLEELAEQFLHSYEAGEVINVHLSKDLGNQEYKYCFDATGKPFLEPINASPKEGK